MKRLVAVPFVPFCEGTLGIRLTNGQRVFAKVAFDGVQPKNLQGEEREIARALFGPIEEVNRVARRTIAAVIGRGSGKTFLAALRAVHALLTADCSMLARGEHGFVLVVAPEKVTARQLVRFALGAVKSAPAISPLLRAETTDGFTLERPDGAVVALETIAASRGGSAGRGRTLLLVVLDETSFFQDEGHTRNDVDIYGALMPRLVKGGQAILLSTPWTDGGLLHKLYSDNFAAPRGALACLAPTLLMRDQDPDLAATIAIERERDPDNAAREYDCRWLAGGSGLFFDGPAIDRCVGEAVAIPAPRESHATYHAGADTGFSSDSSAIAVVQALGGDRFRLVALEELRPTKETPLSPSRVVARFAEVARTYGCVAITADPHYRESVREHLEARSLDLRMVPGGQDGKAKTHLELRRLLHEERLELPKHYRLLAQLKAIVSRPLPGGGLSITSPRKAGGGHGDLVSALVCATWAARQQARVADYDPALFWGMPRYRDSAAGDASSFSMFADGHDVPGPRRF